MDQTTIGRRIQSLEQALEAKLFQKGVRGYDLTETGKRIFTLAEEAEALLLTVERKAAGEVEKVEGLVRLTAPEAFATNIIIPSLPGFLKRYPKISFELLPAQKVLSLSRREADVAVRMLRPSQAELIAKKVGELAFAFYASLEYLDKRGDPKKKTALAKHDFVALQPSQMLAAERKWHSEYISDEQCVLRTTSRYAMCAAIRSGLGIGVLPCSLGGSNPLLVRLSLGEVARNPIWVVFHPDLAKNNRVRVVLNHLSEIISQRRNLLEGKQV